MPNIRSVENRSHYGDRRQVFGAIPARHHTGRSNRPPPNEIWKGSFHQLTQRVKPIRRPPRGLGGQIVMDNLVEHEPEIMLPAVTNSVILDFLESVMGPFVQLESLRINLTESAAVE